MKGILIYKSYFDELTDFSDEQVGKFIRGINTYMETGNVSFDDPMLQGYWVGKKRDFDNMIENYQQKVEKNRENGKKGGRPPKTQNNPKNPDGYLETQKTQMVLEKPTETQHNPENLKESEKESEKDKEEQEYRASGEKIIEVDLYFHKTSQLKGYLDKGYTLIYKGKPFGYEDLEVLNIII